VNGGGASALDRSEKLSVVGSHHLSGLLCSYAGFQHVLDPACGCEVFACPRIGRKCSVASAMCPCTLKAVVESTLPHAPPLTVRS